MKTLSRCFFLLFFLSAPLSCGAQAIFPPPAPSTPAASGFGAKADEDSFKASVRTELQGQNLWKPLQSESRQLSLRAVFASIGLLACFLLGPVFWTLAAMCGAAASYWGASALAGGAVLAAKMPGGEGAYVYIVAGAGALLLALLSWIAMLVLLVPPLLNMATAVCGRLGGAPQK